MNKLSLIFVLFFSISILSCSNTNGNQKTDNLTVKENEKISKTESNDDKEHPEYLTYDTFLEKVWNFEENPQEWKYLGDTPCVIDFYADWCKPCKMVAPIMDEMAEKYKGKVKIYKVNTDKEGKLASVFRIQSIPSVLFIPQKGEPKMQTGALPKESYVEIIETDLLKVKK